MDVLDEMTKEEIVSFLRRDYHYQFNPIKKSDVLFSRWQAKSKEMLDKRAASADALQAIDGARRDEYARQFNATKDNAERMALLAKIAPYDKALKKWWADEQKLNEEEKELDELYASIDEAREEESKQKLRRKG